MRKTLLLMAAIAAMACSCDKDSDCIPCQDKEKKEATLKVNLCFEDESQTKATAYVTAQMLRAVVTSGTGGGAQLSKASFTAGKTGTTSDDKDHWFIGLTPYYCTATWWGYDEQIPLSVNYSKHPPTLAWKNVMNVAP